MDKIISFKPVAFVALAIIMQVSGLSAQVRSATQRLIQMYTITPEPAENGSYIIRPNIPKDGRMPAGRVLTIKSRPGGAGFIA